MTKQLIEAMEQASKVRKDDVLIRQIKDAVASGMRHVEGARNLVTLGQFYRMMPLDPRRKIALMRYLFDPAQPTGYECDMLHRIDTQYTKRAADSLVSKIIKAKELVDA